MMHFARRRAPTEIQMNANLKVFLNTLSGEITEQGLVDLCDYLNVPVHEARLRLDSFAVRSSESETAVSAAYENGMAAGLAEGAAE